MDNFWNGKRVLITGGTGFLGKHLVDSLLSNGANLRIIDFRDPSWQINNAEFVEADIRDAKKITGLSQGFEYVFHLAAMPSIARGKFKDYYEVNVLGTRNILEASLNASVKKFLHVSSSTVYGIPSEFPLKETSPVHPMGKYSGTKLEAENSCREFIKKGLNVSIIRPRVIMGPGRIGIFSILFEYIRNNQPVYTIGNGKNIFQFTNVFDMSAACIKAAEFEDAELFNVGSDETLPVREELSLLIKHAGSKSKIIPLPASLARITLKMLSKLGISPLVDEQFSIADKDFKLDTSLAKEKLGWQPQYSNLDSLIQAYDWYIAHLGSNAKQYKNIFGVLGKFKHSKMGAFQK